ncbi:MAG: hypothetical protein JWN86_1233 [Planctomycetota bacterium]|nr:hypothetical protein [Planctomycetota bacterium]
MAILPLKREEGVTMASVDHERATVDELTLVEGKAELIDGRIVHFMPTGFESHQIALAITISLKLHERQFGGGVACGDNLGFVVPELPSGRESFSPDAAFYSGPLPENRRKFVSGPPTFAVEVRSEGDHGPAVGRAMAQKRADNFAAGTRVVWDVDPENDVIVSYRGSEAGAVSFAHGDLADAEPAVRGWRVAVSEVFA